MYYIEHTFPEYLFDEQMKAITEQLNKADFNVSFKQRGLKTIMMIQSPTPLTQEMCLMVGIMVGILLIP